MNIVPEMMTKLAKSGSLIEIEEVILRSMLELGQRVMQTYLEALDDQLSSEVPVTHQMINRQFRTVNFCFGPVTFKRRDYRVEKAPNEFFLDQQLALAPRSRQSPYLVKMMAKLGQATTMRNTAMALNMLLRRDLVPLFCVSENGQPTLSTFNIDL